MLEKLEIPPDGRVYLSCAEVAGPGCEVRFDFDQATLVAEAAQPRSGWEDRARPQRVTRATSVPCGAMDRIAIIGCGGSGKTTFGRHLADIIDVSVTYLDVVHFDSDWNRLPEERFAALQEELVAADKWVIDGNYASTLPIRLARADTVVFLDLPAITCLWGIAQRRLRHGGGQNDQTGVYDRVTWEFIKYVWGYRRSMAPRVRDLITEHARHAQVHTVKSRRAANRLLDTIAAEKQAVAPT